MSVTSLNPRGKSSRYIAIEGPIGVGKTELAKRLADSLSGKPVLEDVDSNPFLERFYAQGRSAALPAQMYFLFARAKQLEELRQADLFTDVHVADYVFAKDRLFAALNLDPDELALYDQVAGRLGIEPPVPDLVVYLQAPVDALLYRIAKRGRPAEHLIERGYLERLADAYARFFHAYDEGPLLIVNASHIDPIHNDADYQQLFRQIERIGGGRHYFNPVSAVLG